jgi:chaperonin GroEL
MLTGGIGVIRVGAYTDTEFNAKKYKFENGINATQAALQEGIVAGGGSALFGVSMSVTEPMFRNALVAPFMQQKTNAGITGDTMLSNVDSDSGIGFDFVSKEKVNMFDAGIIDPFKVTRLALESAVGITLDLIGTETSIVTIDEKEGE